MPPRTTFSNLSTPDVSGEDFLAEYAARMKSLFDAAAFPLTSVGGTGNAVTATLDPPLDPGGLVNGMKFTITWGAANTGAVTLAINGATAVPVVDADNVALGASTLASGRRSLIEYIGGAFRILSSAGGGAAGAGPRNDVIISSSTWTRPAGYDPDTTVLVELWGGGGGNAGGGGAYAQRRFKISELPTSVSITIGAGGVLTNAGGNSSFGSLLMAYGGGHGVGGALGGGGGGEAAAGVSSGVGGPVGGGNGSNTGGATRPNNAQSIFGGGGGDVNATGFGGIAVYGGGGGAVSATGGISVYGGAGGAINVAGLTPGGGGGGNSNGARGECRITIFG